MGLFDYFKSKPAEKTLDYVPNKVIESLDELGYFKYASEIDITDIKSELLDYLTNHNYLGSIWFETSPFNSKDYRHYHLDGEDLFEEGGFTWQFEAMKTLFDKMNFKVEITNHIENWDNKNGLNHSITINGKNYIIFENFKDNGWGEAAKRFAEIINDQLELQNIDERIYLINGGNDGHAVYLTQAQFDLIDPILKGTDRPLKIEDWCRVNMEEVKNYRYK